MAHKLDQINLLEGESLFISNRGSVEEGIHVKVKDGALVVHGPINMLGRDIALSIDGWKELGGNPGSFESLVKRVQGEIGEIVERIPEAREDLRQEARKLVIRLEWINNRVLEE